MREPPHGVAIFLATAVMGEQRFRAVGWIACARPAAAGKRASTRRCAIGCSGSDAREHRPSAGKLCALAWRRPGNYLLSQTQGVKMSDKAKNLGQQARELSPQDRIALVEDVLDSLDRPDPSIDRLWAAEARDRMGAYRRGELPARELHAVLATFRP
jgi:putative addiction module component (TIGR02574 family)